MGLKYKTEDILSGKYPQYATSQILKRLADEKIKERKCEKCGIFNWNSEKISLEIHHVDLNSSNHILSNLMILCPNCHSQMHSAKKIKRAKKVTTEEDFLLALASTENIRQALIKLNLSPVGKNYARAKRLIKKGITYCKICGNPMPKSKKTCSPICSAKSKNKSGITDGEFIKILNRTKKKNGDYNFLAASREIELSDNGIRKRLKRIAQS